MSINLNRTKWKLLLVTLIGIGPISLAQAIPVPVHDMEADPEKSLRAVYIALDQTIQSRQVDDVMPYYPIDFIGKNSEGKKIYSDEVEEFYHSVFKVATRLDEVKTEVSHFAEEGNFLGVDVNRTLRGVDAKGKPVTVTIKAHEQWAETQHIDDGEMSFSLKHATEKECTALLDGKPSELK